MRTIPVDMSRVMLIGTGKVSPKMEYGELADGTRKATGNQAKDPDSGLPLWAVDVLVDDDDARRAEVVGVTVAAAEEPASEKYRPVAFRGVVATIYRDRMTGQPMVSLRAEGIDHSGRKSAPAPAEAG